MLADCGKIKIASAYYSIWHIAIIKWGRMGSTLRAEVLVASRVGASPVKTRKKINAEPVALAA